jgi:hypothetical protein
MVGNPEVIQRSHGGYPTNCCKNGVLTNFNTAEPASLVNLLKSGLSGRFGVNLREAPVTQQLGSINQFGSMHSGSERQGPRERLTGRIHKKVCRRQAI